MPDLATCGAVDNRKEIGSVTMVSANGTVTTEKAGATPSERTILQIENNAANADLLHEIIARRADLRLLTATGGLQGFAMACAQQPDLVVMDMMMPQVSGLDTLVMLRANWITAHIPVIVVSSNAFGGVETMCRQAGAFAYLTKPYQIADLLALIDSALQSAAAMA
jgi:CheY-like chemotaxis protein